MAIDIDINKIATDLNGKADVDLTNVVGAMSESAKNYFSGAGMPSGNYIDLTFGVSESTYTAPANGWFFARVVVNSRGNIGLVSMNGGLIDSKTAPDFDGVYLDVNIEVKKGDTIKIQHYNVTSTQFFRFIYAQGEQ